MDSGTGLDVGVINAFIGPKKGKVKAWDLWTIGRNNSQGNKWLKMSRWTWRNIKKKQLFIKDDIYTHIQSSFRG